MEGDAGTGRLNSTDGSDPSGIDIAGGVSQAPTAESLASDTEAAADGRRGERIGRGWLAAVSIGLLILAGGIAFGGCYAWRMHDRSAQIARDDAVAVQAAKDCVTATQAPDPSSAGASQAKIVECSTGDFGAQAAFYGGMIVEAYQAANVKVEVSEMRAAVERHNDDGSIEVLVAVRTKVSNSQETDQQQGYRLRVRMQRDDGTYKIANLDQVTT